MIDKCDGLRFLFIQSQDFKVTMHDELGEFPDMTLPSNLANVLSAMLMEQHQLRTEKKNNILKFKSVLEILEETGDKIDKEVLIALISNYDYFNRTEGY